MAPRRQGTVGLTPSVSVDRETYAKRGPLALLRDPTSNEWRKFWFVLARPYLRLYTSSAEVDLVAVVNVSTVRVEQSPEIEQMLDVSGRNRREAPSLEEKRPR